MKATGKKTRCPAFAADVFIPEDSFAARLFGYWGWIAVTAERAWAYARAGLEVRWYKPSPVISTATEVT